jgi:hypothetical protein
MGPAFFEQCCVTEIHHIYTERFRAKFVRDLIGMAGGEGDVAALIAPTNGSLARARWPSW